GERRRSSVRSWSDSGWWSSMPRFARVKKRGIRGRYCQTVASVDRPAAKVWNDDKKRGRDSPLSHGGRAMADKGNDPAVIWQTMIGEMEKNFNAFANQAMTSPEFSRFMNQFGGVSAGLHKQLAELMEKYLTSLNLPSRAQMTSLGERLQTIESQLNEITYL